MRRDTVTGRIILSEVTPNESTGSVLEDSRGIAPGDKVDPDLRVYPVLPGALTKALSARQGCMSRPLPRAPCSSP